MPPSINRRLREQGLVRREMTIFLRYETHPTQHYCMFCKEGLFRSQYRAIDMAYGNGTDQSFLMPPISMQCKKCGTLWHLSAINQ